MFGYVNLSANNATKEEKKTYREFYCGLCHVLNEKYGRTGTMGLSYDMVFLTMLLSDLEDSPVTTGTERCSMHPLNPHSYRITPVMDYAADMQILLSYFSTLDNVSDGDAGTKALEKYQPLLPAIKEKYPRQWHTAEANLGRIDQIEKEGTKDLEYTALLFGEILGDIFVDDEQSFFASDLWALGCSLGRFIYILDAWDDREKDKKKGSYNPLPDNITKEEVRNRLLDAASSSSLAYERLALDEYVPILNNIIYSGIWSKFDMENKK